ncbi:hypothetical protein NP493_2094g00005 [Ridgeia piscesae]|uniref:Uncharacterized protein n=1 Tax=Ridgeia piscesae TaxID=27915 RepID=A0AAD9N2Z9_RIDPI|nr:hypothetical protein NP493_2094g00005 [Ridgeia piscesae]
MQLAKPLTLSNSNRTHLKSMYSDIIVAINTYDIVVPVNVIMTMGMQSCRRSPACLLQRQQRQSVSMDDTLILPDLLSPSSNYSAYYLLWSNERVCTQIAHR